MSKVLVCIEAAGDRVQPVSLELLSLARELAAASGGSVEALLVASSPAAAGELGAADCVVCVAAPALQTITAEAYGLVLAAAIEARQPQIVLCAYSPLGLDVAPAAAARLGWPLVAYCTALADAGGAVVAHSLVYGGKLLAETRTALPAIFVLSPGSYPEAPRQALPEGRLVTLQPPAPLGAPRVQLLRVILPDAAALDLTKAERIVCVGRGIGDQDSIALAAEVAELLGAELAGSRPVVDSGWLPKARQVGKSGTKVAPKLYVAVGVSGAPEHLEGMARADLIVAVNTDARAPIFGVAHYGTTVDLFDLLPALAERLRAS